MSMPLRPTVAPPNVVTCPSAAPARRPYDWTPHAAKSLKDFEAKWPSAPIVCLAAVCRFRDCSLRAARKQVMTIGEGQTILQQADSVQVRRHKSGLPVLAYRHESLRRFKDNADGRFTHAPWSGRRAPALSTGNTSASSPSSVPPRADARIIFIVRAISYGKLARLTIMRSHGA